MNIDPERLRAELTEMKRLIASDPAIKAQFDRDGNGVIDGEEWEEVRKLVIQRLQHEAAQDALAEQLFSQLDPAQLAEMKRMEADEAQENESSERDWGNLELAFDPREDKRTQDATLANQLYERELGARYGGPRVRSVQVGEEGSLADCRELILEQEGGVKQFFGNMFRRSYLIRDPDGTEVGRISQNENEMLQNMTDLNLFRNPDTTFVVEDYVRGETYTLCRSSGLGENSVSVSAPTGRVVAHSSWSLSFLRRKYEVRSVKEQLSYYVRRRVFQPFTFDVLDPFEEPIGTMQRGWSGLGFLTMGNLFHIQIDGDITPGAMWGFVATALLADLDSEAGSRKSGLDFFNS